MEIKILNMKKKNDKNYRLLKIYSRKSKFPYA